MTAKERMEHYRRERERHEEQELKRHLAEVQHEEQEASTPCTTADAVDEYGRSDSLRGNYEEREDTMEAPTTDAAVPLEPEPEPAAIEAPGDPLVAEVARLKAKSQNWRRRYEEETSHRGMADDKLVSLQERMDTLVSDLDASETIIQSLRLEIQTQSFKEINALHEEHSADRATTRKTIARLKQMIVDARTAAQTPAKVKKRRKFVATGQRNGHDTMVKADGTLSIQCKDCGGVYSKSYMVKHWKPKSGGCQAKT